MATDDFDPQRDLIIERHLNAPRAMLWRCWSEPNLFERWFAPEPVKVRVKALDLSAAGAFVTEMVMPDGNSCINPGCFLAVEPGHRIVFTDALTEGFRPHASPFMTVTIVMTDTPDGGTLYIAHVKPADIEARKKHEEMGFQDGWGTAIRQLETLAQNLESPS